MVFRSKLRLWPQIMNNRLLRGLGRSLLVGAIGLMGSSGVQAHMTQVKGDIAGTWHVEPNHNPQAGKPATVWVALTRRGGAVLPLSKANCRLAVYQKPRRSQAQPILRPTLKPINAERYQGIPGATVTFPTVGAYQLTLDCAPKRQGDFAPFQMTHDLTVAR